MAGVIYSGSDSDDDWTPITSSKAKRAIISSDDDSDSGSFQEIVATTSDEEDGGDPSRATTDTDTTGIIAASDEEVETDGGQNQRSADSGISGPSPVGQSRSALPTPTAAAYRKKTSDSSAKSLNNSTDSEASTISCLDEEEEDTIQLSSRANKLPSLQAKDSQPAPSRKKMLAVTSTPVVTGYKKPSQLDVTAIPLSTSNFNATLVASDESAEESPPKAGTSKSKRQPPQAVASGSGRNGAAPPSTLNEDVEDMLVAGLNDITLKGRKDFRFRQMTDDGKNTGTKAVGATCLDYFSEEEEDDESISANFDFNDADDSDSDIQVLHQKPKPRTKPSEIVIDDDSDDGIKVLSEKMKKLPLGHQAATDKQDQHKPKKTIFLNEPPPIERKTYAYDPTNAKHEEYYGDVQRTVAKLAKTLEEMPMPDDEETEEMALPRGLVKLFDHQQYGLRWLSWREREFPGGGILADEMGLGKTIMIIALIMKSKMEAPQTADENWIDTDELKYHTPAKSTLVVCPVGCIIQWNEEISNKGKGLKVYMYHGPHRTTSAAILAQHDVVLTTYHTIIADVPKDGSNSKSPLKRLYWRRIVLDEAHNIRNPKTAGAQSICQLKARHRWAVTGTPIHNKPEDFYSMAKFLGFKPFDDPKVWDFWIGLKSVRKAKDAVDRLHTLGKALILRRTKAEVEVAGGNVQKIPPKKVEKVELELTEAERRVYDHLMKFAKNMFQQFLDDKNERDRQLNAAAMTYTAERRKKNTARQDDGTPGDIRFSHMFALIVRLRQCTVLPYLIHTMLEDEEVDEDVSFDELNDDHLVSKVNPCFERLFASTKVKRILDDLEALRNQAKEEDRPMDKVVVISSWTTTLEILHDHLRRRRFSCVFITGKEKNTDRADNMKKFNNYPEKYHICLLSLTAGGVGLNLVGGNHVFFVEPHWNPQLELQAQDRCHRFGQKKDVFIKRYIVKDTIEDRIISIQEGKIDLADGVLKSAKTTRGGGLSIVQMKTLFQ